ncbi:tripartite motif-containing protein 29 isoform X2 [Poecile atricapillus]|uniref:tripartite motif-containing protein 29 isoform X2 n=1 Tax=Poecile atricapillus TaxID=48891 RepID=UPI002739DB9D|nr:tripartite motif-containing protein 29 isoform X2 [Poecile atricapillus]
MEAGSAARTNGTTSKPEDVKSPTAPKKEEEAKKATSPGGGEKEAIKGTGGAALETGQIKSSLFSGSDWKRPIIQFVESSDEKRSTYFSMDSADSKKMQFASGQIGDMRRPALNFPEKGDLRKSLFSLDSKKSFLPADGEGRKSLFSSGQMGDLKKSSLPLVETGDLRRPFNKPDRAAGSRPRVKLEDVLCDSCIDNKQKAVKSCLVCQASFCELHLKPHLEGAAFRDHQLLDPIRDFEARKCPVHGKTMELFCQTDQMCICYLCMFQEHKNHSTVTVEIEKAGKEAELSLQKEQLQLKIIEVEDEVDKWQKERDRIKNYTTNEKATVDQHFKELIRDLERQRDEVKAALDQREKIASENVKEIVDELEERAKLLREDKENREQIHQISDSVLFLQEFGALMRNYVPPPSLPTYSVLLEGESMSPSMGLLRDDLLNVCMRHVEKICKADLGRNFIERNHMENGGDHRFMMNNYEWNQPDNLKRFSMFLSPKGTASQRWAGSLPAQERSFTHDVSQNLLSLTFQIHPSAPNFNPRSWEFSSFQATEETLGTGNSAFSVRGYPSIVRHQSAKVTPQTWKSSSKQSVLSHYRPFYVNKGNGATSNEAP